MHFSRLLLVSVLILTFSTCKKDPDEKPEDPAPSVNTVAKMVTVINTQNEAIAEYEQALLNTGDSTEAFMAMANWLAQHGEVEKVFLTDYHQVEAHFKNGLVSPILIIPVAADGTHLVRGGGSGQLSQLVTSNRFSDDYIIENDKVMIFIPYLNEFYPGGYPYLSKFNSGRMILQPTLLVNEAADLQAINSFSDYGFIIINSHGNTEGFEILTKIPAFDTPSAPGPTYLTEEQLRFMMANANNLPPDKVESGELKMAFSIFKKTGLLNSVTVGMSVLVTEKYIRGLPVLNNAIVFGNHCFSGYNYAGPNAESLHNLAAAWNSAGAISYYGYAFADGSSRIAMNTFCRRMEDSLITNLLHNLDSTGIAHLAHDLVNQYDSGVVKITGGVKVQIPGTMWTTTQYNDDYPAIQMPFYFEHFHDKRYKYKPCGDTIIDARDGQVYPTVCIGDQVWMAKNLNYAGAGICYDNSGGNCDTYGRLYSITELTNLNTSDLNPSGIRGLCPDGWHVPSTAEWLELFATANYSAHKLCSPDDWPTPNTNTNEYGLKLLPGGAFILGDTTSVFLGIGTEGQYWSSSAELGNQFYCSVFLKKSSGTQFINYNPDADSQNEDFEYEWYMSCRCVKD